MKITCQSCQSKYTIADEKIHGKVAKIRCRKCGETIEVDGTRLGAEESAVAQPTESPAPADAVWTVNIADDDQRTLTLPELVDAYHSGLVTAETYLWADGMTDWVPLAEVPEVVAALGSGMPPSADDAEPVRDSMFHEPPTAMGEDGPVDSSRVGDEDLGQGSGFSPTSTPQPLGARDEQSVLFSLSALTASAPKVSVPPSSTGGLTEDSGLIDLNALAAKAQESSGEDAEPTPAPAPLLFPAALGSVEPVTTTAQAPAPAASSSKAPIFIGAGIAIAGVAVAAVMALRPADPPPAPAPMPTAAAVVPSAAPTPEPAASAAPPASAAEPAPAPAAKKAPTTTKKAPAKTATKQPAKAPATTGATKPTSAPAKKSNCGCAPADLQCQIRCSATGK